ncbi:Mandelate racemase [Hyphomicrobiales bacterium]|nr:Mandelate racemase [Hyphomicrobiales bacterium]CAH1680188.1 Mandelate racemase [Hyphomicrobiales bacterium]
MIEALDPLTPAGVTPIPFRDVSSQATNLRITDLTVTLFAWDGIPAIQYGDRNPVTTGASELGLVTLHTNEGISGYAFLGSSIRGARLDVVSLMRNLKPIVLGRNPLDREQLWVDLHRVQRATTMRCIGAIDIALWDIAGKVAGLPIARLIGAARDRVPAYASSASLQSAQDYVDEALAVQRSGYHGYKLHPPKTVEAAVAACRAVRAAVGSDMRLMVDTGGCHSFTEAVRLGRALEELDFFWFEDPLAEDDIYNYTKLREKLTISLMATEYSPGGFYSYPIWISSKATDYLRGDVAVKGGLTGILKAAVLADAFRMNFEIHHGGNSLNNIAQLHAALSIVNTGLFEVLLPSEAQKYGILDDLVVDSDGYINAINKPGLGVEIDFDLIKAKTINILR